jgi:hypothetical protein
MSAVSRPNHLFGHTRDHDYHFELRAEWERDFLLWHRHRMVQMRTWVVNQLQVVNLVKTISSAHDPTLVVP